MTTDRSSELSAVLPAWALWAGPLLALVTFLACYLVVRMILVGGALRSATATETWTEQARHVHVARTGAAMSVVVLPVLGGIVSVSLVGPVTALPRRVMIVLLAAIGVAAAVRLSMMVDRFVHGPSRAGLVRSGFGVLLSLVPVLALVALGWFAPSELNSWAMVPWSIAALVVVHLWLRAALLMLRTPLACDADARTQAIVERASVRLGVKVDRVIEFRTRQPNAFAFPWLNVLAFTTGLLQVLHDDELEAITHHEFAHLVESAGLTRLRQAQLYALVPIVALRPLIGTFGIVGPAVAVLLLIAVTEIVRRRGLAAEHASDSAAVEAIHRSEVYGRALEKTYRIGLIPAVLRRSTHGQLHDRLRAAGVEPDFDTPAPPPRSRGLVALLAIVALFSASWFSPWLAYALAPSDSLVPTQLAAALPVYGSEPLASLAFDAEFDERWSDAAILFGAAADVRPSDAYLRLEEVRLWAFAGDCERAESSAEALDAGMSPSDLRYADDLIDWCELTGGRSSSEWGEATPYLRTAVAGGSLVS